MKEERFEYGIRLTNFFPQDILEGLLEIIQNPPKPDQLKTVPLTKIIDGQNRPCSDQLGVYHKERYPIIQSAHDFATDYFQNHEESIMVKHDRGESHYTINGELQTTPPHCRYGVHQDTPRKLHTLIIYLHPTDGDGTLFFDEMNPHKTRGIGGQQDPWSVNCGYWMGIDGERPFHSYRNDTDETRWIFMCNLSKITKIPLDNG